MGIIKKECLSFFICFSMDQLDYITQVWGWYYNMLRPHRGVEMNNNVLDEQFRPQREGPVLRRRNL